MTPKPLLPARTSTIKEAGHVEECVNRAIKRAASRGLSESCPGWMPWTGMFYVPTGTLGAAASCVVAAI